MNTFLKILFVFITAMFFTNIFLLSPILLAIFISLLGYCWLFFISPQFAILLLLFIKPILDSFRGFGISMGQGSNLNINAIMAILIIFLMLSYCLIKKMSFLNTPITKILIIYLIMSLISSCLFSEKLISFLTIFLREISFLIFFYCGFYFFSNEKSIKKLNIIYVFLGLVMCFFLTQKMLSGSLSSEALLTQSDMELYLGLGVGLGNYLMLLIFVPLSFILTEKKHKRLKWIIIFAIFYIFIILSSFRTAWMGSFAGLLLIIFLKRKKYIIFLVALIPIVIFLFPTIFERIQETKSLFWRFRLWEEIIFHKSTFFEYLLGRGMGNLAIVIGKMRWMSVTTVHNNYIEIFFEKGIVGLCIFLVMKFMILKKSYNLYIQKNLGNLNFIPLIVLGMTTSLLVGYFTQSITQPTFMWNYWIYVGAFYGIIYNRQTKKLTLDGEKECSLLALPEDPVAAKVL